MTYKNPKIVLDELLSLKPRRTAEAPRNARGIYGLVDHLGELRYIGSTSSVSQTLYERIHQRHRTGSEDMSHYFSFMYNVGRMWRDRRDAATAEDGHIAKTLRNTFVAQHCAAVWVAVPDAENIAALEQEILRIAPASATAWNGRRASAYDEPANLVDITIETLRWGKAERDAVARQLMRFRARGGIVDVAAPSFEQPTFRDQPVRFFALDVETANNDRASICQIGIAAVFEDGSVQTWMSYLDPQTRNWSCSYIHGITASTVSGAPTFRDVLPVLKEVLGNHTIYQHSGFDSSAIAAACRQWGLSEPRWSWKDSVQVARQAWPELRGNKGHGLASLKTHLGISFTHHDAAEDARAAAEVVLLAEKKFAQKSVSKTEEPAMKEQVQSCEMKAGSGNLNSPDKWNFCLTSAWMPGTGETMTRRPRRNHSPAFKAKVALAAIRGEQTLVELSQQLDVHANQIKQWKDQLLQGATGVFGDETKAEPTGPTVDVKTLHARIGELTLENNFLSDALGKAGLLGGKK